MKGKNLVTQSCVLVVCFQILDFETSNSESAGLEIKFLENYFFIEGTPLLSD